MPESEGSPAHGQSQSTLQEACKFISRGVLLNNQAKLLKSVTVRKNPENTNKKLGDFWRLKETKETR